MANNMTGKIDHVVILMLENRGFDHVLGWLYDEAQPQRTLPVQNRPASQRNLRRFEGLARLDTRTLANPYKAGETEISIAPIKGARSPKVPSVNPHEDFIHIFAQMYNVDAHGMADKETREAATGLLGTPSMTGFVQDYATRFDEKLVKLTGPVLSEDSLKEIMEMYTPEQLPVLNGLARRYAVSDQWFCSVPTQTNANRAFSLAGTSRGMVTNLFYVAGKTMMKDLDGDALPADTQTLFHLLEKAGVDWGYYWQAPWPSSSADNQYARILFPSLADKAYDKNFAKYERFKQLAGAGKLPAVSFLEPAWGGGPTWTASKAGNEYHPVSDTTTGEDLVKEVYDLLHSQPNNKWQKTLFIVTFDENGGTYDHFPPPPPPVINAPGAKLDKVPKDHKLDKAAQKELDERTRTQFGYEFDGLGVRVPTILVSPLVEPETVFRSTVNTPFDHTSIIATILDWQSIDRSTWGLGSRVANAPTFDWVVSRTTPRTDIDLNPAPQRSIGAAPLKYGDTFVLRYIGSRWAPIDEARYVSAVRQFPAIGGQYYPTLGPKSGAVKLTLAGGKTGDPIQNGGVVILKTTEEKVGEYSNLGAWKTPDLYYYKGCELCQTWEIRLAACRNDSEIIHVGDEVAFFNKKYSYQRMIMNPKDGGYLTTVGGEWAHWRIE